MAKRQLRRQSAAAAKCKITDLFQRNTVETNDGVVELVYRADPGGSEAELQDCDLSSDGLLLATICCDECGDKQAVTIVMSPSSRDVTLFT